MDTGRNQCIPVGYGLFHIYGGTYVLIKYKVLEVHDENIIAEFKSLDEVKDYVKNKEK